MTAEELIAALTQLKADFGNLEVWIEGTEWGDLPVKAMKYGHIDTLDERFEAKNDQLAFLILFC